MIFYLNNICEKLDEIYKNVNSDIYFLPRNMKKETSFGFRTFLSQTDIAAVQNNISALSDESDN